MKCQSARVVAPTVATRHFVEQPVWVTGCHLDYVSITAGVPQIAVNLRHRPSRQSRASCGHCLSFSLRQRLYDIAGTVHYNLGDRVGRSMFQRHNRDWCRLGWKIDRQRLQGGAHGGIAKARTRACPQLSRMIAATSWTAARKFRASLS